MKAISLIASCCLLLSTLAVAQDTNKTNATAAKAWIKKFEGAWTTTSHAPHDAATHKGSMTSRSIGNKWVVNEIRADMGGFAIHAQQTLGFDSEKKVFTATWVDNACDFKWNYEGKLDEEKKQLIFVAEGPDMTDTEKTSRYRDIYEFRNEDLIITTSQILGDGGEWKTFMSGEMTRVQASKIAKSSVAPLLMFYGKAEKAMGFYVSIFPDSKIEEVNKYSDGENGKAGSIKHATFRVAGTRLMCIDSPVEHEFEFTPSVSLYVDCESKKQVESIFARLSEGGKVLMPLADYGFSTRFGWVTDRFGVSWQLNFGELK